MPSETLPKTTFFLIFKGKTLLLVCEKIGGDWQLPKATLLNGPTKMQVETILQKNFAHIEITDPTEVPRHLLRDAENNFGNDSVYIAEVVGNTKAHTMGYIWFAGKEFIGAKLYPEALAALHLPYTQNRLK